MSLGVCIKSPEGLVLAAESRVSFGAQANAANQAALLVTYDNATKVLSFHKPYDGIGVVTWGAAAIGLRTVQSYIPEFEATLVDSKGEPRASLDVAGFADALSAFYVARFKEWQSQQKAPYGGPPMVLIIGGYDDDKPYGRLFECNIPNTPKPIERNPGDQFGITWGGQREITDRLVQGFDSNLVPILAKKFSLDPSQQESLAQELRAQLQLPMPLQAMPLQDCVDLALLFLQTTIETQRLTITLRGCGGPVDLAVITRSGLEFVQRKKIHGETIL